MDHRRAEAAYFQYAILKVVSWYPNMFDMSNLALHSDLQGVLPKVTVIYHSVFMSTYARKYTPYYDVWIDLRVYVCMYTTKNKHYLFTPQVTAAKQKAVARYL